MEHYNAPNMGGNPANEMANLGMTNVNLQPNPMPKKPVAGVQEWMPEPCEPAACPKPCPPVVMPAVVDPTRQNFDPGVEQVVIVPHIHPSHTTHRHHTHYVNAHYFPHTESVVCTESCEDIICPPPPCPPCGPHSHFGY